MRSLKGRKVKGFTLVELIVVIAILAILIAIAVPKYKESRTNSLITAHNSNVKVLESAAMNYIANGGGKTTWTNKDDAKDYIAQYPEIPKGLKELEGSKNYIVNIASDGEIDITPKIIKKK